MRAVGIILAGGNSRKMHELTAKRAVAAMPIAGSYRAIDLALYCVSTATFWIWELGMLRSAKSMAL